ncbi:MAG: Beta-glucosidase [Bacteroidetes bacterium]|nr:Beta-glucosidase [Bacteroidota bacterium]
MAGCNKNNISASQLDPKIEKRIDSIMSRMSLEEKVGQMAQYTVDILGISTSPCVYAVPFKFDAAKLDTVLGKYKVGSILNTSNNTAQTTEMWEYIVKTIQLRALKETGIPVIYGIDAIHGTTYTVGSTLFPQEIGMAATFNPQLMEEGSRISAYETRASNIPWTFAPILDLGRDARWSRQWENYGEDAYLSATMGAASVKGFQGENPNNVDNNHIAACLKHYMGYGVPVSGKDRTPSIITESDLREKHFEPFRKAVETGALSVMVNSGIVNNVNVHASHRLLTEWLKEELKFDGVIVTDWADVQNLLSRDHIAKDYKDAVRIAINAGIDMVMEPYNLKFCDVLTELVKNGDVSQERMDDAVRRVLRMKFRLGLFEHPYWSRKDYPDFGSKTHQEKAKLAADESITLLKNADNILPLKKNARILVTGPNANSMRTLNGGWSYSWQGEKTELFATQYNTIAEALEKKFGKTNVKYTPGMEYKMDGKYFEEKVPEIGKAVAAASAVDYIVLCIGENSYCETPGNLEEGLALSQNQTALANALIKTGKPVILVLNEGRPRIISSIEPGAKAVVQLYLPGNFGADALADILSGDVNPSGRLPYTYPKNEQGLSNYDHKPGENIDGVMEGVYDYSAQTVIQYPFGYGLSYTKFDYSNLLVDKKEFSANDSITLSVYVKNSGIKAGKETVMLFSSDLTASISPDVRRLRAFQKISLNPGEMIANLVENVKCRKTKIWETPNK